LRNLRSLFTSFSVTRNAAGIESVRYSAISVVCLHLFLLRAMQLGFESARLWSILPVSNNIAELPGLVHDVLRPNP